MRPVAHQAFTQRLKDILDSNGKEILPNMQLIEDPLEALQAIARTRELFGKPYTFLVQKFDPPINGVQTREITYYPKVFVNSQGMGSTFDGSGVVLVGGDWQKKARVFKFHMCEHEWDESGANHNRGWHPKRCTKCGFDASIDSGD